MRSRGAGGSNGSISNQLYGDSFRNSINVSLYRWSIYTIYINIVEFHALIPCACCAPTKWYMHFMMPIKLEYRKQLDYLFENRCEGRSFN